VLQLKSYKYNLLLIQSIAKHSAAVSAAQRFPHSAAQRKGYRSTYHRVVSYTNQERQTQRLVKLNTKGLYKAESIVHKEITIGLNVALSNSKK
jgi:hypothetical protein